MANCIVCEQVATKQNMIYEDELIYAMLHPDPLTQGHILVLPKQHYTILEQLPPQLVQKIFTITNKLCVTVFEKLGKQGTNVIVQNGTAAGQKHSHLTVNIIPREINDNLPLTWQPKQISDEEMNAVESKVKEAAKEIKIKEQEETQQGQTTQQKETPHPPIRPTPKDNEPEDEDIKDQKTFSDKDKENYLIKNIQRMP